MAPSIVDRLNPEPRCLYFMPVESMAEGSPSLSGVLFHRIVPGFRTRLTG